MQLLNVRSTCFPRALIAPQLDTRNSPATTAIHGIRPSYTDEAGLGQFEPHGIRLATKELEQQRERRPSELPLELVDVVQTETIRL